MRFKQVQSSWHLSKIAVLAAAFLASVVLNNMALRYIPVSFAEVLASSSQFWQAAVFMHPQYSLAYRLPSENLGQAQSGCNRHMYCVQ